MHELYPTDMDTAVDYHIQRRHEAEDEALSLKHQVEDMRDMLMALVRIAEERPNVALGHVLEHETNIRESLTRWGMMT